MRPIRQLFPHAIVTLHQGGSGTTGEALGFRRTDAIVPYGWNQADNAVRVANGWVQNSTVSTKRILCRNKQQPPWKGTPGYFNVSLFEQRQWESEWLQENRTRIGCDAIE